MEYIQDLKGVTVYRDTSREKQVYYRLTDKEIDKYLKEGKGTNQQDAEDVQCNSGACDL